MLNDPNKLWLVKSGGRVLGPMNKDEIESSLRTKELVVLDEISRPFGRWRYIRDEDEFEKIVLELKNREHAQSESTITGTVSLNTVTGTTDVIGGTSATPLPASKVFEVAADPRKWNKTLRLLLGLIAVIFLFLWIKDRDVNTQDFDQIKSNADYLNGVGDYEEAKAQYENALKIKDDPSSKIELASLLIHFQDTVSAQRILEGLLSDRLGDQTNSKIYNLLGIIYLYHYNFKEASESFSNALNINQRDAAALFNKGITHFFLKDLTTAEVQFYKAMKEGGNKAISLLMLAQIHTQQRNSDRINDLIELLDDYLKQEVPYYQELIITQAYLNFISKNTEQTEGILEGALDMDPDLSKDTIADLNYYQEKNIWSYLVQWIIEMKKGLKPSARIDALLGYAMFKNKEKLEGRSYIENALKLGPNDALINGISSYINFASDKDEDANAALMVALQKNNLQLPHILKARLCKKANDVQCQLDQWQEVQRINPQSVSALSGIAEIYIAQNNFLDAKKNIDLGLKIDSSYIPLLKLKKVLDDKSK